MHIIIERIYILHALQRVLGFIGNSKPSLPILGHVLLQVRNDSLFIIGSNTDMEIVLNIPICRVYEVGQITAPLRKFFDICRVLSEKTNITLKFQKDQLFIYSENSSFSLITFSSLDFPKIPFWKSEIEFFVSQDILRKLIESTKFSMGKQDVRYYLNGMLFEFNMKKFSAVTTDGHRLSLCVVSVFREEVKTISPYSIIVPRKYIVNVLRVLNKEKNNVRFKIGKKNVSIVVDNCILTSKLINGVFPDYRSVIPKESVATLELSLEKLRQSIKRSVILCNEKFHVVEFSLSFNQLKILSKNSEHEKFEQSLDVIYTGRDMDIGFNVHYILDVLNVIESERVRFCFTDENSAVQITGYPISKSIYIVMPIRL